MILAPVEEEGEVTDFKWRLVSAKAAEMLETEVEALLGRCLCETSSSLAGDGLFDKYVEVVTHGATFEVEHRFAHKRSGWWEIRGLPLDGNLVIICRDITERKTAEEALRQTVRRLRMLTENMTDLVCMHDVDGTFLYVSPSSKQILERAPGKLEGTNSYDLVHPDDVDQVRRNAHRQVISKADFAKMTYRVERGDGQYIWVESTTRPIRDNSNRVSQMLTCSREITDQIEAEKALEQTNEELQQRNRELEDFAYVASHDLQEPLRKVRTFANLMREDYGEEVDETGNYYLERMQDGAERMSNLIADLLAYARITTQGSGFKEVDLNSVAQEVKQDLEIQIRETGGTVSIAELPSVTADRMQMRQLLQNLISNALKFHREGVPPVVEVAGNTEMNASFADVQPNSEVFYVRDNGIGLEAEHADRIFTPFRRLHGRGEYKGTGMGLAICRRIVERHGGQIHLESEPGKGTMFMVELPADPH